MRRDSARTLRCAVVVFFLAALTGGAAQAASKRRENWKGVEEIAAGKRIVVELSGQPPERCRMISADAFALACAREPDPDADWRPGDNARVVIPRAAVRSVWGWEDVSDRRVLIRIGVGFAIGALVCSEAGPAAAFLCAGVGALIGVAAAANAESGPRYSPGWSSPRYRGHRPDLRTRLWYQAPSPAAAPVAATP